MEMDMWLSPLSPEKKKERKVAVPEEMQRSDTSATCYHSLTAEALRF